VQLLEKVVEDYGSRVLRMDQTIDHLRLMELNLSGISSLFGVIIQ